MTLATSIQSVIDLGSKAKEIYIQYSDNDETKQIKSDFLTIVKSDVFVDASVKDELSKNRDFLNALGELIKLNDMNAFLLLTTLIDYENKLLGNDAVVQKFGADSMFALDKFGRHQPMVLQFIHDVLSTKEQCKKSLAFAHNFLNILFRFIQAPYDSEEQKLTLGILANLADYSQNLTYFIVSVPLMSELTRIATDKANPAQLEALRALSHLANHKDNHLFLSKTTGIVSAFTALLVSDISEEVRKTVLHILSKATATFFLNETEALPLVKTLIKLSINNSTIDSVAKILAHVGYYLKIEENTDPLLSILHNFAKSTAYIDINNYQKTQKALFNQLFASFLSPTNTETVHQEAFATTFIKQVSNIRNELIHPLCTTTRLFLLDRNKNTFEWYCDLSINPENFCVEYNLIVSNKGLNNTAPLDPEEMKKYFKDIHDKLGISEELSWILVNQKNPQFKAQSKMNEMNAPVFLANIVIHPYSLNAKSVALTQLLEKISKQPNIINDLARIKGFVLALEHLLFKLVSVGCPGINGQQNLDLIGQILHTLRHITKHVAMTSNINPRLFSTVNVLLNDILTFDSIKDSDLKTNALVLLSTCTKEDRNKYLIAQENKMVPTLFKLSKSTNTDLSLSACGLLLNLSCLKNQMILCDTSELIAIFHHLINKTNNNPEVLKKIVNALIEFSGKNSHNDTRKLMLDKEPYVIPLLLDLAHNTDDSIAVKAMDALILFFEVMIPKTDTDNNIYYSQLIAFTNHEHPEIQKNAVLCLQSLAANPNTNLSTLYDFVLPIFLKLITKHIKNYKNEHLSESIIEAIVWSLYALSDNKENQDKIIKNQDLMEYIIKFREDEIYYADEINLGNRPDTDESEEELQGEVNEPTRKKQKLNSPRDMFFGSIPDVDTMNIEKDKTENESLSQ